VIEFLKQDDLLVLRYWSTRGDSSWVDEVLTTNELVKINKVFYFSKTDLIRTESEFSGIDYSSHRNIYATTEDKKFILGRIDGSCFKISKERLKLKHDLFLSTKLEINEFIFIADRDISVFRKIDEIIDEPIIVADDFENSITLDEFHELIKNFPTTTELKHYAHARISRTLFDHFQTLSDAQLKLDRYLKNRKSIKTPSRTALLNEYEPEKFCYVRDELSKLLEDDNSFSENDWQKLIVEFLLLIFPKYVAVLEKVSIKDFTDPTKETRREIDLVLVDANGTIDIIEIKKPFPDCLLSKQTYRDSYTPKKELSGAVMQVEKYLFHLSKWGREGEKQISQKKKKSLPPNFELKIVNPKGMIILGRDKDFTDDQKFDFEIIRRKYANVIDIMTYDDLLRRLDNIIFRLTHTPATKEAAPSTTTVLDAETGSDTDE